MTRYTVTYCQYNDPYVQELIFNMTEKKCPKCGMVKDIGDFYTCKSRRDGFTSWCKSCSNISHKNYVENNREHLREYDRMQYYAKHEEHLESRRKSNLRNKDSIKIARKKWYEENKENILKNDKEYYEKNRENALKTMHKYYLNHIDEIKEKATMRKRTVRGVSDGTVTKESLEDMFEQQGGMCAYCGKEITKKSKDPYARQLDHIIPICRGGLNTLSNVHWVCPRCNKSKGGRLEEEWLKKERMKPTDIWTNHTNPNFKEPCHYGDSCHQKAPRGTQSGTQGLKGSEERARIPEALCEHIVDICGDIQ